MMKSVGKTCGRIAAIAALLMLTAGCNLFGHSSSSSSVSSTPSASVQGVETPTSISVVSATNAN